jgi:sporulation protein YlmC with PRC-barrel domain
MRIKTAASLTVLAMGAGLGLPAVAQVQQPTNPQEFKAPSPETQGQGLHNGKNEAGPSGGEIQTREPDMVLVSNLWNATVYGPDESRIGDVNDLIIKSDGKIEGVVVGVGGFLGVGEKNVALKLDRFKVVPEADGRARIMVSAKKEELQQAPEFKSKQEQGQQQKQDHKPQTDGTQPKS